MSVNWANSSILQEAYLQPLALERLQGKFVGKHFFPDEPVDNLTYTWYYYGTVGRMIPEVGENDPGPYTKTQYEQRVGRCRFYREVVKISSYARTPLIIRNRARDEMENLVGDVKLRIESLRINAIINAVFTSVDAKGFFWKDCSDDNSEWLGGSGNVDIIGDIIDANQRISQYGKGNTDTIMAGSKIVAAMKKNTELRDWERSGPLSVNVLRDNNLIPTNVEGSVGRIAGHEVFEINISILSDQKDPSSALQPLLEDDVYIFEKGERLGKMFVFEGLIIMTEEKRFERCVETQGAITMNPEIQRPQFIYKVGNVIAP